MSVFPSKPAEPLEPGPLAVLAPVLWAVRIGGVVLAVASFIVAVSGSDTIDGISMGRVLPGNLGWYYLAAVAALSVAVAVRDSSRSSTQVIALGAVIGINATAAIGVHGSRAFLAAGVYLMLGVILIAIGAVVRGAAQQWK